jgi:hypothetical protein
MWTGRLVDALVAEQRECIKDKLLAEETSRVREE